MVIASLTNSVCMCSRIDQPAIFPGTQVDITPARYSQHFAGGDVGDHAGTPLIEQRRSSKVAVLTEIPLPAADHVPNRWSWARTSLLGRGPDLPLIHQLGHGVLAHALTLGDKGVMNSGTAINATVLFGAPRWILTISFLAALRFRWLDEKATRSNPTG